MSVPAGPSEVPVPSVALIVLDGWGLAPPGPGNAISLASTPVFDGLWNGSGHTTLTASGRAVGLPDGQMGNSEVGHLNLGAGSVVKQDLTRIDDAIADGSFFENPVLRAACEAARTGRPGRLHLMGLVSDGGVHSGWEHIEACIELAAREGVPDLVVHAFTDGEAVLHFNFRPDRARQLIRALGEPDFDEFPRGKAPRLPVTTLTEYRKDWDYPVAFPPRAPETTLAEVIAARGERQLHVAETEKYAHVTYFFNGGREEEWE